MSSYGSDLVYAIDYGTSNSLLSCADDGRTYAPLPLDEFASDPSVIRSLLYFPNGKEVFFGSQAIEQYLEREMEGRFLKSIKRFLPDRAFVGTHVGSRPMNLESLIAVFLGRLRLRANEITGQDVKKVVLGRPARFDPDDATDQFAQYRLERGAREAGFEEIKFCPEPLAAAREYGLSLDSEQLVVIADFGGGTSDFTVMNLGGKPFEPGDVLAMGGVSNAGDAYDSSIMKFSVAPYFGTDAKYRVPFGSNTLTLPRHFRERLCSPAEITLMNDRNTLAFLDEVHKGAQSDDDRASIERLQTLVEDQLGFNLFEVIERAKREVCSGATGQLTYKYPTIDLDQSLSEEKFRKDSDRITHRILDSLDKVLLDSRVDSSQVDLVVITGGTGRVPALRQGLLERFGEDKLKEHRHFHSVIGGLAEFARAWAAGED